MKYKISFLSGIILAAGVSVMAGTNEDYIAALRVKVAELKTRIEAKRSIFGSGGFTTPNAVIPSTITGGTQGSVLFVGANTALTQNNANFYWDDTNVRLGIASSTPGSVFSVQGAMNILNSPNATSTIFTKALLPSFSATSTTATTTISTGGFQVGRAGDLAAFTVGQSATTSVGVGTSTVTSHQFGVQGNALIGNNGTTTLSITSSTANTGGCIQMRAASSSDMYRIYLGNPVSGNGAGNAGTLGLIVEPGACR